MEPKYVEMIRYILMALEQQDVTPYLHGRSKHVFTVHQLIILLVPSSTRT